MDNLKASIERKYIIPHIFRGLAIVICVLLLLEGMPMANAGQKRSLSQRLADTAGEVIIEAVKFGLDEAGTRLLGPTAWNGFKRIAAPVVKILQKRFPALSFGNPQNEKAQAAAYEAAQYLRANSELRILLLENFDSLASGQEAILSGINRLERAVEKTSQDVAKISQTASEILNEINELKSGAAPSTLPDNVDMSSYMEEVLIFARAQTRREGRELYMPVFTTILMIVTIEQFMQRVLEDGIASKMYKTMLGPYSVSMTAGGKYKNASGYTCRKYTIIQPDFANDLSQLVSFSRIYCREEGFWKPMQ